jgi:hypothetical protein
MGIQRRPKGGEFAIRSIGAKGSLDYAAIAIQRITVRVKRVRLCEFTIFSMFLSRDWEVSNSG